MSSHSKRALVTVAVIGVAAGTAVFTPSPAVAHPFGDPQTVTVSADEARPEVVHVKWRVGGPDDLTVLGVQLGLLPADRVAADGTVDYRYEDPGVVGASALFTGYLLERITVSADGGAPCTGTVAPVAAVALKGATAAYTCPAPVSTATVAVRTLTDLHPAYRTLATGPHGQRTVYENDNDTHDWAMTGVPGTSLGRSALVQLGAVIGGLVLAILLLRRVTVRRAA
ncbi:hypothetical protein [Catenuloplanes japonicus]|uniref:hypothetical protein n=1 Tax=Catenuloplanes japonicus TaxID=33876 RepID=UPI000A58BCC2|nr:hypothetical protein [Catenuloplanes japonicus]